MNKAKIMCAVILAVSAATCIFSACKKPETIMETTTQTQINTTKNNGYTYNEDFILDDETLTQYVHIVPPVPTKQAHKTEKNTQKSTESAANKAPSAGINEEANGLNILSKTSPVAQGNNASIIITGTPNAEYTIEFYEADGKKAAYSGLETTKADSNGIASWSFKIENACESGEKKVIIREKNSDKYIQTSITVI